LFYQVKNIERFLKPLVHEVCSRFKPGFRALQSSQGSDTFLRKPKVRYYSGDDEFFIFIFNFFFLLFVLEEDIKLFYNVLRIFLFD